MSHNISRAVVHGAFAAAVLLYVLQIFTPLRLTTDGIMYLSLADSATRTGFWAAIHQPGFPVPKGYPVFVFLLMKMGLFRSATVVISNLLLFALGLYFSFKAAVGEHFDRGDAKIACLLTMFSFCAVKFITQGMSDFLFFALSSCVCWLLTLERWYKWIGITVCSAAAIEVRFIGLALIAPILVVALRSLRQKTIALGIASGFAIAMLVAGVVAGHQYLASNMRILRSAGVWQFAFKTLHAHFQDFGEMTANLPMSKLPGNLGVTLIAIGALVLMAFLIGVFALRKRSLWLCCYLAAYSALVLPWPFTDPRFWLPAMPFVILALQEALVCLFGIVPKRILVAYGMVFCILGVVALGYSTKLTFAGKKFASEYGDGRLTDTYLAGCSTSTIPKEEEALALLKRYQWHCTDSGHWANAAP